MARYLYSELSSCIQAISNCQKSSPVKSEWLEEHQDTINSLVKQYMPSGSGFDSGTTLDLDQSHADKLVFRTSFHHMDEMGGYDGWTEHTVTVTPALSSHFHLRVSGRNRNDIKSYIYEMFDCALLEDVEYYVSKDFPTFKALNLEIKSEWLDQCTQRWSVLENGVEIFTPIKTSLVDPLKSCQAFAVQYWKSKR